MSTLKQVIRYLKNPVFRPQHTSKKKLWNIFKFWGFFSVCATISSLPGYLLLPLTGFNSSSNAVLQEQLILPVWFSIVSGVIFAPIREEATFRLWLKPNLQNISIALGFLIAMILEVYIRLSGFTINNVNLLIIHGFLIPAIASGLCYFVLKNNHRILNKITLYILKNFSTVFWLSHIVFALIHFINYDIAKVWYIVPILVLPQFIIGLYLGFLRVNYGFQWSLVAHSLHNFLALATFTLIGDKAAELVEKLQATNWSFIQVFAGLSIQDLLSFGLECSVYISSILFFAVTIIESMSGKRKFMN